MISESPKSKVLFVDDDLNILMTIRRQLAGDYDVDTAHSGADALTVIRQCGPYAVVVSDQRMPGMDGAQFLAEAHKISPDSVRVMLTGYAEMQNAIEAVNKGHVFRFMLKPVRRSELLDTMQACMDQHRLILAERDMLKSTLRGAIQVLSEILGLLNPASFSQGMRVRGMIRQLAERLEVMDIWQFELAAMLSQIGCIAISPDILKKVYSGDALTSEESQMFASHPTVGSNLLSKIPRLEPIAEMIRRQHDDYKAVSANGTKPNQMDRAVLGGHLLRVSLAYDRLLGRGLSPKEAMKRLMSEPEQYHPGLVAPLSEIQNEAVESKEKELPLRELQNGMVIAEHIYARNGLLLAPRGLEVTSPLLAKLNAFSETVGIKEPIKIMSPTS